MKNLKRKFNNLVSNRAALLREAETALNANDQETYDAKMGEATAMNAEIQQLLNLIDEQERFMESPAGTANSQTGRIPNDVDALVDQLRNGDSIVLNQNDVLSVVREAVNSVLIGTDTLAKPTGVGTTIRDNQTTVSGVLDRVSVMDLSGCGEWQEPYVKTSSTAGVSTAGNVPTTSEPVFRVAALKPVLVDTIAYVSRHIENLTPVAYYEKVKALALTALRNKIVDLMTNGDGATFFGFANAKNTKGEAISKTYSVSATSIDEKFLRKLVMNSGGDETVCNGILQLTKADLIAFGDVRGSDKKPVYEITLDGATNGNTGVIKDGGLAVPFVINSKLNSLSSATRGASAINTMIYGDASAYILGLFSNYSVQVDTSYKFGERLWTVLGEVMAGGNLCAHEALTVVQLAAKAG